MTGKGARRCTMDDELKRVWGQLWNGDEFMELTGQVELYFNMITCNLI